MSDTVSAGTKTVYVQIEPAGVVQLPKDANTNVSLTVDGIDVASSPKFQTTIAALAKSNFGDIGPTDYVQFQIVAMSPTPFPGSHLKTINLDGGMLSFLEFSEAFGVPADFVIPPNLFRNGTPEPTSAITPSEPPPLPTNTSSPTDPQSGLTSEITPGSEAANVNAEIKNEIAIEAATDKNQENIVKLFNLQKALSISEAEVEHVMQTLENTSNALNIANISKLLSQLSSDYNANAAPTKIETDIVQTTNEIVGDVFSFGFGKAVDGFFLSKNPFGGPATEYSQLTKIAADTAGQAAGIYASWYIEDFIANAVNMAGDATPTSLEVEPVIVFRDPGPPPTDHFLDPGGSLSGPLPQYPADPTGNPQGGPPPTNIGQQINSDGTYAITPTTIGVDIANLYISFIRDHLHGLPDAPDAMKLALDIAKSPPASDPQTIAIIADTIGQVLGGSPTVSSTPIYLSQIIKDEIANTPPTPGINPILDYATHHIFNSETGGGSIGHFLMEIGNGKAPSDAYTDTTGKPAF